CLPPHSTILGVSDRCHFDRLPEIAWLSPRHPVTSMLSGLAPPPATRSLPDVRGSAAMLQSTRSASLLALLLLLCGSTVHAKPAYKKPLADYFAPTLAAPLNDCRTCHLPDKTPPPTDSSYKKPHNPFGARLAAVGKELALARKPTDIAARIEAVADEDSDG